MIGRILIFLFVFSVSAFADVAAVGNQTASLVKPLENMGWNIANKLVPIFFFFGGFLLLKHFISKALGSISERRADAYMKSKGYERYEPDRIKYKGRSYRKVSSQDSHDGHAKWLSNWSSRSSDFEGEAARQMERDLDRGYSA